jgi:NAD(P)-dependent dehydrogenase (short-subunit alcohol dehydrogenase family)
MGRLDNRVAIVTGAGRGLGREHALLLAAEGASVVVNDLGGDVHGGGADQTPAQQVVEEITASGGKAVVSGHDVADWEQAEALIQLAVETFGKLDVLVNNAGILRDRYFANMSEDEWDAVIRVHLKGHAATSRHAVAYWREMAKTGQEVKASVIHTSSISGYVGSFGQANYSAAKLAVVALSRVISHEVGKYGVRSNVVSPGARTRITMTVPGADEFFAVPDDGFDEWDPGNVSPLIGWLATADCPADGQCFHIQGNKLFVMEMMPVAHRLETEGRWTLDALDEILPSKLTTPPKSEQFN